MNDTMLIGPILVIATWIGLVVLTTAVGVLFARYAVRRMGD